MMNLLNKNFLLFLTILLFLLPLISLATAGDFHSTGPQCYPYSEGKKCPFDRQLGSDVVPINLTVTGYNPLGSSPYYCLLDYCPAGQTCPFTTLVLYDQTPNSDGTLTPVTAITPTVAGLVKPVVGNVYQKRCYKSGSWPVPIWAKSKKVAIVSAEPCEIAGGSIFSRLNQRQHTTITEASFRDWGIEQTIDRTSVTNGLGSGDKEDIKNEMNANQQCTGFIPIDNIPSSGEVGVSALRALKVSTDARQPAKMGLFAINSLLLHDVVVLKITEEANTNFTVKILDSGLGDSAPEVNEINCHIKSYSVVGKSYTGLICDHSSLGDSIIFSANQNLISNLRQSFFNYCSQHSVSSFCVERQNMSSWVENNYPNISNFTTTGTGSNGVCSGWADFVLKVAYLGDFVGMDYHPNDGKIVGRDCTANHYPIPAKAAKSSWLDPQNWLGNVYGAWAKLWPGK